jgi:adenylosuccinate synthase
MNIAILGSMFGDEGKGHITHHMSRHYDWVIRFSGGANAGHTIYRDGVKYVHNLMPSFDWRSYGTKAYLGSGMVIDLEQLYKEVTALWIKNPAYSGRVYVDPDAFLVLPGHKEEDKSTNGHIGSTNRGIGPAYKDKISRQGTRLRDIMDGATESRQWIEEMKKMRVQFKSSLELQSEMEKSNLLFEGAQGILLDINHGIYPYVSCGDAGLAGIHNSGFGFAQLNYVYGVAKCYTTKVGEGPFPTELHGKEAEDLRQCGNEYGATTGRPRRVGWLDLPALRYACQKGNINRLILTKFDILDGMDVVPVCTNYDKAPICSSDFFEAKPNYKNFKGWSDSKDISQLKSFISEVEHYSGVEVSHISRGIDDKDIIAL